MTRDTTTGFVTPSWLEPSVEEEILADRARAERAASAVRALLELQEVEAALAHRTEERAS